MSIVSHEFLYSRIPKGVRYFQWEDEDTVRRLDPLPTERYGTISFWTRFQHDLMDGKGLNHATPHSLPIRGIVRTQTIFKRGSLNNQDLLLTLSFPAQIKDQPMQIGKIPE